MPLYEYICDACGQRFERIQKFSDPIADVCSKCGKGPVHKQISAPGIQFKGSGWYITDYAKKGNAPGDQAAGKSDKKPDGDSPASTGDSSAKDSQSKDSPSKDSSSKDSASKDGSSKDSASKDSGSKSGSTSAAPAAKPASEH